MILFGSVGFCRCWLDDCTRNRTVRNSKRVNLRIEHRKERLVGGKLTAKKVFRIVKGMGAARLRHATLTTIGTKPSGASYKYSGGYLGNNLASLRLLENLDRIDKVSSLAESTIICSWYIAAT